MSEKLPRYLRASEEVTEAMHDSEWCKADEVAALEQRVDELEKSKTCLIDKKSGARIRIYGQDLWDANETLEQRVERLEEAAKFARDRLALLGHRPSSDVGMAFSALEAAIAAEEEAFEQT